MAAAEFGHFERLRDRLAELGADPFAAMEPFRDADRRLPRATPRPSDWLEGLVKAYVGDGLAADFYREIAAFLDADTRDLIVACLRRHRALGVRRRPGARRDRRPTRGSAAGSRCGAGG